MDIRLPKQPHVDTSAGAATYITAVSTQLSELARRHKLSTLAYILDMARLEAEQVVERHER